MATITEDYISFETAKLLKKKGFTENCLMRYNKVGDLVEEAYKFNWNFQTIDYSAPTLQMTMKWLREMCKLHVEPHIQTYKNYNGNIYNLDGELLLGFPGESPEQVCETAIKYCLKYLI